MDMRRGLCCKQWRLEDMTCLLVWNWRGLKCFWMNIWVCQNKKVYFCFGSDGRESVK